VSLRRRLSIARAALGFLAAVTIEVAAGEPGPLLGPRATRR
jgi:hypothetical protein